jgi:hypothetical protein
MKKIISFYDLSLFQLDSEGNYVELKPYGNYEEYEE